MHGDEGELEAAGEEAEHQQHVGAVAEGFGERGPERLLVCGAGTARAFRPAACDSASDSGRIKQHQDARIP